MARLFPSYAAAMVMLLAAPPPARAADDFRTRAEVRELGGQAIKLYDAGKYAEALDLFQRANKLIPAPSLAVRIARSLVKLGRLVEASEMYLEATRYKIEPGAPPAYRQAQKEAQTERDLLLPRIPKLRVIVTGPMTDATEVLLDGKPLPRELFDTLVPVDPGTHDARARRDDVTVKASATVAEGGNGRVELKLPELIDKQRAAHDAKEATWRAGTIAAWSVAGAGLVTFAVAGGVALKQKHDLDELCPERSCRDNAFKELDAYNGARIATTVGLGIGAAGVVAGTTLLFLRPKPPPALDGARRGPRVEPRLGAAGVALRVAW